MNKTIEITKKNIYDCLALLSRAVLTLPHIDKSFMKISHRGVPLFIVEHKGKYYSVCYFLKYKNFKVFSNPRPYCKKDCIQESIEIETGKEVFRFFKTLASDKNEKENL